MFNSNASTASSDANYIEDVFSTYLYTGTGATQNVVNGIDLSTKGGMVWFKSRSNAVNNSLFDTTRGATKRLISNATTAEQTYADSLTSFNTNGFSLGADATSNAVNTSGITYASWAFREQAKFFDVVTYTGNGTQATTTGSATNWDRTIDHNLKSQPGFIIIKRTDSTGDWLASARNDGSYTGKSLYLNTSDAAYGGLGQLDSFSTTTTFSPGSFRDTSSNFNYWNINGATYVAYIFAHNAGGFGLTGTDNVISCGSFTTDGSGNATMTLGYEPQFIIIKNSTSVENWVTLDNMRGWTNGSGGEAVLNPNLADAESAGNYGNLTSTGATWANLSASKTYIYIAIRRGPMKVPTSGTTVFAPITYTGDGTSGTAISGGSFPTDLLIGSPRSGSGVKDFIDRLRGAPYINSTNTAAEAGSSTDSPIASLNQSGFTVGTSGGASRFDLNSNGTTYIAWLMGRAPSFFDEVCCTQTTTVNHNLGVTPELVIYKSRSAVDQWYVCTANNGFGIMNFANAWAATGSGSGLGSSFANATSTTINGGTAFYSSGVTLVAYLFATCAGVSKVGSYTGTGATQQINCGFTAGSRFVMIKRTDSTGDWYVWDSARGIVAGNDPYLLLNSTAAEVTSTDYVDTYAAGFELTSTAPAALNASGGTYIFLAIA